MSVLSVNVYCPEAGATFPNIPGMIDAIDPDVIGFQEADEFDCRISSGGLRVGGGQLHAFDNPDEYGSFMADRGDADYETNPILYRRSRFDLDPDHSSWRRFAYSRAHDDEGRRAVIWVCLIDRVTRKGFYVFNTHLSAHHDWVSEYAARNAQAGELAEIIRTRAYPGDRVIVMGDFNAHPWPQSVEVTSNGLANEYATKIIQDATDLVMVNSPKWATHEQDGDGDEDIIGERTVLDYIFTDADAHMWTLHSTGRAGAGRFSDHAPLQALVSLERPAVRLGLPDWSADTTNVGASYRVWVKTASTEGAGTDAALLLDAVGDGGRLPRLSLDNEDHQDNERHAYEFFVPNWGNVGPIRRIRLTNTYDDNDAPGWRSAWVLIEKIVGEGLDRRIYRYRFGDITGDGWDGWLALGQNDDALSRTMCIERTDYASGLLSAGSAACGLRNRPPF